MASVENEIIAAGAQIVWVMERNTSSQPGSAMDCANWVRSRGGSRGICVGDGETEPLAGVFDVSPFAIGRGFDIIVDRETMVIDYVTTHGTPAGNENPDGQTILSEVRARTN